MDTLSNRPTFLLITIIPQGISDTEMLNDLRELKSLVETYGGDVRDLVVQRREVHDKGMYIGKGKVEEAAEIIKKRHIDIVVLNAPVKPGQIHEMKRVFEKVNPQIQVWDRVDLILEIFAAHAKTAEAKLQIEMAAMKHMGPRIYGMGYVMSRQGGGIGTLGVGETNTELMRRHWRMQMKKIEDKIKKHSADRERQMEYRLRQGMRTVSLIGYTNAGKTSLFNLLTGKKNTVENAPFVTLDSSTGKVFLPDIKQEILLSDTIGFIKNLPHSLVDAFRSTLMESVYADVLLLVIDASDPYMEKKIAVVEMIIKELRLRDKKRMYVFNKIDKIIPGKKDLLEREYAPYNPQFISILKKKGIDDLVHALGSALYTDVSQQKVVKRLHV